MKHVIILLLAFVFNYSPLHAQLLDSSFGSGGIVTLPFDINIHGGHSEIFSVALQSDGKIIAGGHTDDTNVRSIAIMRFTTNGVVDSTFGTNGRILKDFDSADINTLANVLIQQDDKIIIAGTSTKYTDPAKRCYFSVARYTKDGAIDSSFNGTGVSKIDIAAVSKQGSNCRSAVLQSDGKIVMAGNSGTEMLLMRLKNDGVLDSSFNNDGIFTIPHANPQWPYIDFFTNVAVTNASNIVALGIKQTQSSNVLWQLKPDGTPDSSFGTNGSVTVQWSPSSLSTDGLCILPDNRIAISGSESFFLSNPITIHNADGTPDTHFGVKQLHGPRIDDWTLSVPCRFAVDTYGRIYSACPAYSNSGVKSAIYVFRFNQDGTLDKTFSPYGVSISFSRLAQYARCIIVQKDGKILLGGASWASTTDLNFAMVRVNTYPLGVTHTESIYGRIKLYPNPPSDILYYESQSQITKPVAYRVYNTIGQTISTGEINKSSGVINISGIPKGLYILVIGNGTCTRFSKI